MAVLTLVAAYIIGLTRKDSQVLSHLQSSFSEGTNFHKINDNPLLLEAHNVKSETFSGYLAIGKAQGWGGPLHTATIIDKNGVIERVVLIDHKETPSFFFKIQRHQFLQQFTGRKISDPFVLDADIDSVTGATMSSRAITEAIREGSHAAGKKIFNLPIKEERFPWKFGTDEILLLLLYAVMLFGVMRKIKIMHYVTMAAAFIFLGFYLNAAISIGNISSLFLGYFPSFKENIFWWLLIIGALLMPLILRRNLYCSYLCPFGALQEFTAKIGGINIRLSEKSIKFTKHLVYFLAWFALILIFLTSNPAIGAFEPFATFFALEGIGVQWFLLPAVVLGSFVFARFFCRFFCPVGVVLNLMVKARHNLGKIVIGSKQ
jgi:uncharacterized protein with FMN-binding domain